MDFLSHVVMGFDRALSPDALLYCLIGVTVGTFVGALPGIGTLAAISLALPFTFHLDPTLALIMLAGIFYGTQYGGSIASILLNMPGSPGAAVTCLDGYPLAQQGKAGMALFITAICSFAGGTFSIILAMAFAPVLAQFAQQFTSAEYFSAMLLGLVAVGLLGAGSPAKGLVMVAVGIIVGLVGVDMYSGQPRFTFGNATLRDGFSLISVAMGLFGVAEIFRSIGTSRSAVVDTRTVTLRSLLPTRSEMRQSYAPTARGSVIGAFGGIMPGVGPAISAFMAYGAEVRIAKDPSRFGKGAVEGIAAPEAANNSSVQAAFIPTLSLGIPGDAVMAVLMGAMLIHGITPGPLFITQNAEIFWGLIASFWIGNVMLLVLNIPLIGIWVKLLSIPYRIIYPAILVLVCVGVYSVRSNLQDVYFVLGFGFLGYFLTAGNFPVSSLLLGMVLGPLIEDHFRRSLLIARGDPMIFLSRPISATLLALVVVVALFSMRHVLKRGVGRLLGWGRGPGTSPPGRS